MSQTSQASASAASLPLTRDDRWSLLEALSSAAERKALVIHWFVLGIVDSEEASFWMSSFNLKHE
jgi:hypothetical protein